MHRRQGRIIVLRTIFIYFLFFPRFSTLFHIFPDFSARRPICGLRFGGLPGLPPGGVWRRSPQGAGAGADNAAPAFEVRPACFRRFHLCRLCFFHTQEVIAQLGPRRQMLYWLYWLYWFFFALGHFSGASSGPGQPEAGFADPGPLAQRGLCGEALNRDAPAERDGAFPIGFRSVAEESCRLDWSESDLPARRKSDPAKLAIAARLRREATLSIKAIAARMHLGTSRRAKARLHAWLRLAAASDPNQGRL
jgi:hypothetical protein